MPDVLFEMMGSPNDGLLTQQRKVQRLLGQSLLRLQAYERLMKAIVAVHDISGSAQSLEDDQTNRSADIGRRTLGTLVNNLLESFLTIDDKQLPTEKTHDQMENGPEVRVQIQLALSDDDLARAENGLKELVLLRNNLVHHFLDRHDLSSLDGCGAAEASLNEAAVQIKRHSDDLRQWAEEMERSRTYLAEVIQSGAIHDFLVECTIPWPITAIVSALPDAFVELARDGWAPIAQATDWVAARYLGELPAHYGCRTWRQVLHQAGIFELRYVQTEGQRVGWYRVRHNVPQS